MLRINNRALTIITSDLSIAHDPMEIIADTDENCPSTIGLKNYNEHKDAYGRRSCDFMCKSCWKNSLQEVEDFVIKWKYKGSDEYV